MTQKDKAKQLVEAERKRLGSYTAVASKVGVSEATISLIAQTKYGAEGDAMLTKVIRALSYEDNEDGWKYVPISITKKISKLALSARDRSLFVAISEKAGGGKSGALRYYMHLTQMDASYYLRCREWNLREFLEAMCRSLGIELPAGKLTNDNLGELIYTHFSLRRLKKPQLILDEFNKLKPQAKRFLIPLFNECEGFLSVIVSGTEDYRRELETGVKLAQKGCDELVSRLGSTFIGIAGATLNDARDIFNANGVEDETTQRQYFDECNPCQVMSGTTTIKVVKDLRRIKRIVQRHQLLAA